MGHAIDSSSLVSSIGEAMANAGAAVWGIAAAGAVEEAEMERFDRFIAQGRHASMDYLERYRELRANPLRLLEGTPASGAVIAGAFPYTADYNPSPDADRIARYALGDDYHEVLRKRLKPVATLLRGNGFQGRICVDSAPILERYWAQRAGVGRQGRNHQLSIPGMGSYFFLAEIVTDAPLPATTPRDHHEGCNGCGACSAACPTGALRPDGSFDAALCINYLTIEHRGPLPETVATPDGREIPVDTLLDGILFGCDRCQEVCPLNRAIEARPLPEFSPRPELLTITRKALDSLTPEARATLLRRSPLLRALRDR